MSKEEFHELNNIPELFIKQQNLELIKSGQKSIEVRAESPQISSIGVNRKLKLTNRQETIVVNVVDTRKYHSIDELLQSEVLEKILPGATPEQAKQIAKGLFPKNTSLVAIEIKLTTK